MDAAVCDIVSVFFLHIFSQVLQNVAAKRKIRIHCSAERNMVSVYDGLGILRNDEHVFAVLKTFLWS